MQHRLQILKQKIDYLKCVNKSLTQEHNEKLRRSIFVSLLFGVATEGDLLKVNNEIKRTQGMMTFLLSLEASFTKYLKS